MRRSIQPTLDSVGAETHRPAPRTTCTVGTLILGETQIMKILAWLTIGGLIGWLASLLTGTDGRQEMIVNIVVGIIGAALGGWLLGGAFGATTISQGVPDLSRIVVLLVGAALLIETLNLARRG